jgi:hypothetical protein
MDPERVMSSIRRLAAFALLVSMASGACHGSPPAWATAALFRLRAIAEALNRHAEKCGGYPPTLASLLAPSEGVAVDCRRSGLLESVDSLDLIAAEPNAVVGGYEWLYSPEGPIRKGTSGLRAGFELRATWVSKEEMRHSFWTSEAGIIRVARGRPAGPADPELAE